MILDREQISELLSFIDLQYVMYIGDHVGADVLSDSDLDVLESHGVSVEDIDGLPTVEVAYKFGRLAKALGDFNTKDIKYSDLLKYIRSKGYVDLSEVEKATLEYVKNQSYSAIKGLGESVKRDVSDMVNDLDSREHRYKEMIRDEADRQIRNRSSYKQMMNNIGKRTDDWTRKLGRIVETEMSRAYQHGRAGVIMEREGVDAMVYKDVYPGACVHCIRLFTTAGIGSAPKVFKLSTLIDNGTNVGVKPVDYKPTIDPIHPYCFSSDTEVMTKRGWKLFSDLNLNDEYLSVDLSTGGAGWNKAVRFVGYHYSGIMNHYKSHRFDLLVTPDHMNVVNSRGNKKWRLVQSKNLNKDSTFLRTIPSWVGIDCGFIHIGDHKYNASLLSEFMGYYMSEGSCSEGASGYQIKISQTKYLKLMASSARGLFDKVWEGKDAVWIPVPDSIGKYFKGLGYSHNKTIPSWIMDSGVDTIKIFLSAFCSGDGSVRVRKCFGNHESKEVMYYTSSEIMASQLGELILKVGGTPSYSSARMNDFIDTKKGKVYKANNPVYHIRHGNGSPSHLGCMKEERIQYDDMVYDVELERWHTLVVRRNGKVCVSGNCRCELNTVPFGYKWSEESRAFSTPDKDFKRKTMAHVVAPMKITIGEKEYVV